MTPNKEHSDELLLPEATVGGLIFNANGELFLMKSDKWNGKFCIPGGHIELGETMKEAVEREIKEETNLDVSDVQFHSLQDCVFSKYFHKKRHFIFVDFVCKAVSDAVVLNNEATDYTWIKLNEIEKYPIEAYTLQSITHFLNKENKSPYIISTNA